MTLTLELPERLAARLGTRSDQQRQLESFLIGAVEVWLRRQAAALGDEPEWSGAFENSAADFVDRLIDDNHDLFEELADEKAADPRSRIPLFRSDDSTLAERIDELL